ncbi:MAG: hypothetical protein RRY34_08630, partial [Victivallaceae bacterium]
MIAKKSEKKIKKNWIKALLVIILYGLPLCGQKVCGDNIPQREVAETSDNGSVSVTLGNSRDREELTRLRGEVQKLRGEVKQLTAQVDDLTVEKELLKQELLEILNKFQKQNASYRILQQSIGSLSAGNNVLTATEREAQLTMELKRMAKAGLELAVRAGKFCDRIDLLLKELPLGYARQAEIKLEAEQLRSESRRISVSAAEVDGGEGARQCKIVAVNPELNLVILSVGSVHGAFNGLICRAGEGKFRLTVVAVREYLSAAVITDGGSPDELSVGMEAVTEVKNQT